MLKQTKVSNPLDEMVDSIPRHVRYLFVRLFNRIQDPEPESNSMISPDARGVHSLDALLGWLPLSVLIIALGMLSIACAFVDSRNGGEFRFFLYPGLIMIFSPVALRLLAPSTSRIERLILICIVGVCCYFIKVLESPLHFYLYDEFLHWRATDDIARSGHLFGPNAMLPISSYYPGLEIVTNAFSTLSKLNTFNSGLVVIGVARLMIVLSLFALNEWMFRSARMASLATLLYMANPHFIFFDSQFAYESLALPFAVLIIYAILYYQSLSNRLARLEAIAPSLIFARISNKKLINDLYWIIFTGLLVLAASVFIHHVTNFFLDGLFILWAVIDALLRRVPIHRSQLTWIAILAILLTFAWINFNGNPVLGYLFSYFETVPSNPRELFVSANGQSPLLWEQALQILSVALILLSLPFGLLCLWQRYRSNTLLCTFGIVSIFYPISLLLRFTSNGTQITDRSSAFLFIAMTPVFAICITHFWPVRFFNWKKSSLLASAMSLVFLGGFILSGGSGFGSLPGQYEVGADARSIELMGISAAIWAGSYLGPNNIVGTDRTNQILMGTYGGQRIVTTIEDHIDISSVFFSPKLESNELSILRRTHIRYIVVDLRLAQAPPIVGYYFVKGESDPYHYDMHGIDPNALTKFNTFPGINRVFDDGDIVIYNMEGFVNAAETS